VGISAYLSYYGYLTSFGALALPFTIVLAIGLFGADILIQQSRVNGQSMVPGVAFWVLIAFFSASSNFNYLYTNFMESDVVQQTLDGQYEVFRDNLTETKTQLEELDSYTFTEDRRLELDRELARLRTQVSDPLRPGCGQRCRDHIENIERILGQALSDLKTPPVGASVAVVNSWYENFRDVAVTDFNKMIESNNFGEVNKLLADIDKLLLQYDTPDRVLARNIGLPILRKLAEDSEEVERRANALLADGNNVQHEEINVTLGRLGEIVYSFQNAFGELPNPLATVISGILSIVVDVIPVFFALAAFSRESTSSYRPARGRGPAGTVLE
jgi:hypothetical protein